MEYKGESRSGGKKGKKREGKKGKKNLKVSIGKRDMGKREKKGGKKV